MKMLLALGLLSITISSYATPVEQCQFNDQISFSISKIGDKYVAESVKGTEKETSPVFKVDNITPTQAANDKIVAGLAQGLKVNLNNISNVVVYELSENSSGDGATSFISYKKKGKTVKAAYVVNLAGIVPCK
jgi:hypothetical protein